MRLVPVFKQNALVSTVMAALLLTVMPSEGMGSKKPGLQKALFQACMKQVLSSEKELSSKKKSPSRENSKRNKFCRCWAANLSQKLDRKQGQLIIQNAQGTLSAEQLEKKDYPLASFESQVTDYCHDNPNWRLPANSQQGENPGGFSKKPPGGKQHPDGKPLSETPSNPPSGQADQKTSSPSTE